MDYEDFKDLVRRTASDKVLRDKAFNITKHPKYDGYQKGLVSMVYKVFDKKSKGSSVSALANKSALNIGLENRQQLAEKLHKQLLENL